MAEPTTTTTTTTLKVVVILLKSPPASVRRTGWLNMSRATYSGVGIIFWRYFVNGGATTTTERFNANVSATVLATLPINESLVTSLFWKFQVQCVERPSANFSAVELYVSRRQKNQHLVESWPPSRRKFSYSWSVSTYISSAIARWQLGTTTMVVSYPSWLPPKLVECLKAWRQSRKLILFIVFVALFLDNMLLTTVGRYFTCTVYVTVVSYALIYLSQISWRSF